MWISHYSETESARVRFKHQGLLDTTNTTMSTDEVFILAAILIGIIIVIITGLYAWWQTRRRD